MSEEQPKRVERSRHGHGPMGPGGMGMPVEKPKDFRASFFRLIGYLRPYLLKIVIVFVFAITSTIFAVWSPKVSGWAITNLTEGVMSHSLISGVEKMQASTAKEAKKEAAKYKKKFNKEADALKKQKNEITALGNELKSEQKKLEAKGAALKAAGVTLAAKGTTMKTAAADLAKRGAALKQQGAQLKTMQADVEKKAAEIKQATALLTAQKKQLGEITAKIAQDQALLQQQMASSGSDPAALLKLQQELQTLGAQAQSLGAAMQKEAAALKTKGAALQKEVATLKTKGAAMQKEAADLKAKGAALKAQGAALNSQAASLKTQGEQLKAQGNALKTKAQALTTKVNKLKKDAKAFQDEVNALKAKSKDMPSLPSMSKAKTSAEKAEVFRKMVKQLKGLTQKQMDSIKKSGGASAVKSVNDVRNLSRKDLDSMIKAIKDTGGKINFKYIWQVMMWLLMLYVFSALCMFLQQFLMSSVAQNTVYQLRRDLNEKLDRLPLKYFDAHHHGEVLSRMTNDIDTISTTLQQSITQVITAMVQIVGYIVMMLTISPILTLIVLASLPLYTFVTMAIAKKSQKYFSAQQKELGELSGHVEEMYTGHKIVKAFGYENKSIEKFSGVNDRLYDAGWKAQFVSGIMFPMMNFISNVSYVAIAVVGGIFVTKKVLELGDITAFIQYSRSFTMPIIQTANIANVIQSTIACAERVFEVLDEQEEIPDRVDAEVVANPQGIVAFENVRFGYSEGAPLIENMNIQVRSGQTVAIVGPTGAGKTTIVNLLMRFYEISGGRILVDGIDIRNMARSSLHALFGMVLQDTWLFNGTIRDNIAYGRKGATEEEIYRAAKAAHADHFIRTLPEGYDTVLNEEASNISQGQKQLLTIARAFLADPAVLILDEATSSVDTRTELLIQKGMAKLMKGRTNFVIAHRLSTIRDAEMILVMNHGSIIEKGTHEELIALKGFYADLYNSQFVAAPAEVADEK